MKKKYIVRLLSTVGLLSIFILPISVFAQTQITIATSVPGTVPVTAGTGGAGAFIANFYQFALIIGGILAFGVIVYGGIRYMTSAGNPSGESDAKEWIEAALLGLLLLAGAYFVLNVVNPQLTQLNLPTLQAVNISSTAPPTSGSAGKPSAGIPAGTGCAGGTCITLPNCTVTANTNCGGTPAMSAVLSCVNNTDPNYAVNEAYPPIGTHSDPGHNTGCAIDVHVSSCAAGAAFMSAAQSCGASKVLNEYTNCGGTSYSHTTGGNIHIDAPKGGGC